MQADRCMRDGILHLAWQPEIQMSDWFVFLIYNDVRSDLPDPRYRSVAGNGSWLLARSFKTIAEMATTSSASETGSPSGS